MTTTPPRCSRLARDVEYNLTRAATLLGEVAGHFEIGIDSRNETALAEVAVVQAVIAASQAHLRFAEVEAALHDCSDHR